jgi:hypothetical protein
MSLLAPRDVLLRSINSVGIGVIADIQRTSQTTSLGPLGSAGKYFEEHVVKSKHPISIFGNHGAHTQAIRQQVA